MGSFATIYNTSFPSDILHHSLSWMHPHIFSCHVPIKQNTNIMYSSRKRLLGQTDQIHQHVDSKAMNSRPLPTLMDIDPKKHPPRKRQPVPHHASHQMNSLSIQHVPLLTFSRSKMPGTSTTSVPEREREKTMQRRGEIPSCIP